jgi:N-6 DNA Methylase
MLAGAESIDGLAALAAIAGCPSEPAPLDADTRRALGLGDGIVEARIAPGPGALRALLLEVGAAESLRELIPRWAGRLSTRTPHALWLVVATRPAAHELAIAAWTGERRPPRVAALIANRSRLVDSDAETVRALGSAAADRDVLTHARWVETLGREALTGRFYRALDSALGALADSSNRAPRDVRRELALLHASRLLFLSFLEAKGWLDGDPAFIAHRFDACMTRGGGFHNRVLRPLFFGTLNTPVRDRAAAARAFGRIPFLNGGLFSRLGVERRHSGVVFSDEAYGRLIASVFGQYRFTAREETATWNEAAVDPEMLGRAFESLMAAPERRRTGAFYTPFALVQTVASAGLDAALGRGATRHHLESLRVLDPACGSGAFLVHALEHISSALASAGDDRDASTIRRAVLTRSIYGVDLNPTAVWLCELRLWLSVVIESDESDPTAVLPLPNLDRNIRVGDALSGRAFGGDDTRVAGARELQRLRERYVVASGARKDSLARQLERAERDRAVRSIVLERESVAAKRRDLVVARRGRDLFGGRYRASADERALAWTLRRRAASLRALERRLRSGGALPFSFAVHFAEIATRGGFNVIVGNPPWVRLHRIPADQRAEIRRAFDVARGAVWEPGAAPIACRAFATQVDLAALFVERSVRLLAPGGALALLVPVKLWRSLAGGGVRRLLTTETEVQRVVDFSDAPAAFDAAVYPSLLVTTRRPPTATRGPVQTHVAVHHRGSAPLEWHTSVGALGLDETAGAPWILVPPAARDAFDSLRRAGRMLAQSPVGRPHLGVKCGCNDAFVVEFLGARGGVADVRARDGRCGTIEIDLLRPLVRGESLSPWVASPGNERIIWTHDACDMPLATLPPHAARWLGHWRRELATRTDARGAARWWSLFRTEGARADQPRVVWADIGREPRASVLATGDPAVALNSCYVARCRDARDAHTLAALLNGPLARAWLNAAAEPARGRYKRYLGWTLALLPVPPNWNRARTLLAPLSERAHAGSAPNDMELLDAAIAAYEIDREAVAPLVAWMSER